MNDDLRKSTSTILLASSLVNELAEREISMTTQQAIELIEGAERAGVQKQELTIWLGSEAGQALISLVQVVAKPYDPPKGTIGV